MKPILAKIIKGLRLAERSFSRLIDQSDTQGILRNLPPAAQKVFKVIFQIGGFLLGGFLKIIIYLLLSLYKML